MSHLLKFILAIVIVTIQGEMTKRFFNSFRSTLRLHLYTAEQGAYPEALKCYQKDISISSLFKYNVVYTIQTNNGSTEKISTEERPVFKNIIRNNISLDVHRVTADGTVSENPECQVTDVVFAALFQVIRYNTSCFKFKTVCGYFTRTPTQSMQEAMDRLCPKGNFQQVQELGCGVS